MTEMPTAKPDRRYNKKGYWLSRAARLAVPAFGDGSEKARLKWLLDFAQRPTSYQGRQLILAIAEVAYFAASGGWNTKVRPPIDAPSLLKFALFVRCGLADLFEGRTWSLRLQP